MLDGSLKWALVVGCPFPVCPCRTECPLARPLPDPDHVTPEETE